MAYRLPSTAIYQILENAGGGSTQAAPVVRQILDAYLVEPKPETESVPSQPTPEVSQ